MICSSDRGRLSSITERARCQGTVRWVTALPRIRATLDKSDTERPFFPSGSFVATAPASRRGVGWFYKHRAILMSFS